MNFKTTLVLLVVLIGLGAYIFFTRGNSKTETQKNETATASNERKLFDVKPEDVTKIAVAPAVGKKLVLEKTGADWKLTEPVSASAEPFEVDSLARAIVDLKAHGTVNASENSATGLSKPRYKIDFTTKDNKSYTLDVGDKSAVGDNLYVAVGGSRNADVVDTQLLDQLEKSANSYRNPKLVNMTSSDVKEVTIKRPDATIKLERLGTMWRMTEPKQFAADSSEVDDVVFQMTGLRATDWVSADEQDAKIDKPRVTVTLSATTQPTGAHAPATQASTVPATQPVVIKIGRYDDVLKKNVLATSSEVGAVAKVAATVVDTLNKKPIEFRDKRVLQINPNEVSGVAILANIAATTQPTTKPAENKEIMIQRHQQVLPVGIAAPTTHASTQASAHPSTRASSQPATAPFVATTKPSSKWELLTASGATEPADDGKIDDLLFQLNPLRAERYLASKPATTQPVTGTYTLKITTQGPGGAAPEQQTITITDYANTPGGEVKNSIATYNDLVFEVSRTLVDKLNADYKKGAAAPAPNAREPGAPEPAGPGGLQQP